MRYLVLLGAPGSGKGTQAPALADALKVPHVSSGDLFRENVGKGTELGVLAKSYMDRGELVPDEVTISMVMDRLSRPDAAGGALFDGFPRTVEQARRLDQALAALKGAVERTLYLKVNDEELLRRLGGRWLCRTCGASFHEVSNPPKVAGKCDEDGGELYQRADDNRETAQRRLEVYHQETVPVVQYYQEQGKLSEIPGEGSIEEIGQALMAALEGGK